jgi:SWI/SNF-related matrix-associated actin-dependent regulator 1 of chromatin subfamily A
MFNRMTLAYENNNLIAKFKYSEKYTTVLRMFKGSYFDKPNERWVIPKDYTRQLCREMRKKGYLELSQDLQKEFNVNNHGFSAKEIEKKELWLKNHISNAVDNKDYDEAALELVYPLLNYQRGGIFYAEEKEGRILLADDMGLGKTIQGIGIAKVYKSDWPVVVVAPASLLLNWRSEFLKWLPKDLTEDDVFVMKNGKMNPKGKIIICSYDYTQKKQTELFQFLGTRGILLVDEAHHIKTFTAKRTVAVVALSHFAKRCVLMTGTPILNRVEELYSIVHAIAPHDWGTYYDFVFKYCDAQKSKFGLMVNGISNDEELFRKLRETIMCRRLKTDVLKQLPEKRRTTLALDSKKSIQNQASAIIEEYVNRIIYYISKNKGNLQSAKSNMLSDNSADVSGGLFEAYRLSGLAKSQALCEWMKEKLEGGVKKLIVFGHHKGFLDTVQETIEQMNVSIENKNKKIKDEDDHSNPFGIMRIDGSTSKDKRFKNQNSFQEDDKCNIALLSINAANAGLTLTAANIVIMGELPWTPGVSRQCEDRVHRIGQKENVNIYYTIADGTFDGALWNMLKNKSMIASKVLDYGKGDEMEENIDVATGDLLSALMLDTYTRMEQGDFDIPKIVKKMSKVIEGEQASKEAMKKQA